MKPTILLEPANPHDFAEPELVAIGESVIREFDVPVDVLPVLRDEAGYGGPLNEVIHVWLDIAETVDAVAFAHQVATGLKRALQQRWKADKESAAPEDRPRTRVAVIYGPDDRPLLEVEIGGADGAVKERAQPSRGDKAAHPRPSATRPSERDS